MNFDQIRELFMKIDQGEIELQRDLSAPLGAQPIIARDGKGPFGTIQFNTDNGWLLNVLFIRGEWDYVQCVIGPNNILISRNSDLPWDLRSYRPPEDICERIYQSFEQRSWFTRLRYRVFSSSK